MAPPQAVFEGKDAEHELDTATLEPGLSKAKALPERLNFPKAPKFDDPHKERAYLKGRLAAAFRIFGKYGFDEGVAGHITVRVSIPIGSIYIFAYNI